MPITPNSALQRALQIVTKAANLAKIKEDFDNGTPALAAFGSRAASPAMTPEEFRASLVLASDEATAARIEAAVNALQDPVMETPTETPAPADPAPTE